MRIPDRYNDCGDDISRSEPETFWKTCEGCGDDNYNGKAYCDCCIHLMLNDNDYLKHYAHEMEDEESSLEEIKDWAKKHIDEFLDSCENYDKRKVG